MSWRDTQANSEGGKFAWTKLFVSTALLLLLQPLLVLFSMALHRAHSLPWATDGSHGPSGQSKQWHSNQKQKIVLSFLLCFLWNFHWTHSHCSFACTAPPKISAEFWAVTGELIPCFQLDEDANWVSLSALSSAFSPFSKEFTEQKKQRRSLWKHGTERRYCQIVPKPLR